MTLINVSYLGFFAFFSSGNFQLTSEIGRYDFAVSRDTSVNGIKEYVVNGMRLMRENLPQTRNSSVKEIITSFGIDSKPFLDYY